MRLFVLPAPDPAAHPCSCLSVLASAQTAKAVTQCMLELCKKYKLDKTQEKTIVSFVDKIKAALKEAGKH